MKYCSNCGSQLDDQATVCNSCGAAVGQSPQMGGYQNQQMGGYPNQQMGGYPNQQMGGYSNQQMGGYSNQQMGGYQNPPMGGYPNQQMGGYGGYSQGGYYQQAPGLQLKTNRGLLRTILLTIVTCGIYYIIFFSGISTDINTIASRYDNKRTMHYCLILFLIGPITFEIGTLVWHHKISARIGNELQRRGIDYRFGAGSFWLWNILGTLILIGPFIYIHKLSKAMNLLSEDYNNRG